MAVGNLALPDPVLQALGQFNESIRGASGDVLKRRQLDLAAQQLEAQAAHQAQLAGLQEKTITGQSAAELAKVTGNLALLERQEGRAGEAHSLNMQTGQQALQQSAEMHPLKMGAIQADIRQSEAQSAASLMNARSNASAVAAANRLNQAKLEDLQRAAAYETQPVDPGQAMAFVTSLVGKPGAEAMMAAGPPALMSTMGGLTRMIDLASKTGSAEVQQWMLTTMTDQHATMPEGAPGKAELAERIQEQRINLGRTRAGQPPNLAEETARNAQTAALTLEAYTSQPTRQAEGVKLLLKNLDQMEEMEKYTAADPTKLEQLRASRVRGIEQEFRPWAEQAVAQNAQFKSVTDKDLIEQAIRAEQRKLARDHGTPEALRATLEAPPQGAPPARPTAGPTAAVPSLSGAAIPLTPGAQTVREQQRARLSGQSTQGQAQQEWQVFERNAVSTGLEAIPPAVRAQAQALYLQLRAANPTAPPIEILTAVKAQLMGAQP